MIHSAVYVKIDDQFHILTDLCYEMRIRRMRIFLSFVTSLMHVHAEVTNITVEL